MNLKLSIINKLKKNIFYKKIYHPIYRAIIMKEKQRMHTLLMQEGEKLLYNFINCMNNNNITYWLEFGTLLGAYRDGNFIPNDVDLDVGAKLEDANRIYYILTENGFRLVREFHVIGENGLEQTYEYNGVNIDVMYFFEKDGLSWCNGGALPKRKSKLFRTQVTAHWFKPFTTCTMSFLNMEVKIPYNTEEHLKEIFGNGYMIYDPNFTGDLNKIIYPIKEKYAIGFYLY